jgi:hypothetical protein
MGKKDVIISKTLPSNILVDAAILKKENPRKPNWLAGIVRFR